MGQTGSTPLDLFKMRVDDLQESLYRDKKLVKDIFKVFQRLPPTAQMTPSAAPSRCAFQAHAFEVQATTTAEEFMEALQVGFGAWQAWCRGCGLASRW